MSHEFASDPLTSLVRQGMTPEEALTELERRLKLSSQQGHKTFKMCPKCGGYVALVTEMPRCTMCMGSGAVGAPYALLEPGYWIVEVHNVGEERLSLGGHSYRSVTLRIPNTDRVFWSIFSMAPKALRRWRDLDVSFDDLKPELEGRRFLVGVLRDEYNDQWRNVCGDFIAELIDD